MKSLLSRAAAIAAAALTPVLLAAPAAEASVSCAKAGGALYVYATADGDAANVRITPDGNVAVSGTSGGITAPESCFGAVNGTPAASDLANVTFSDETQDGSTEARVQDPYAFLDIGVHICSNFHAGEDDTFVFTGTRFGDEMALLADGFIPNTNPSGYDNPSITWDEVDRFEINGLGGGDSINAAGDAENPGPTQPVRIDIGATQPGQSPSYSSIFGGLGPDEIIGSSLTEKIVGGPGADVIRAGGGSDQISGDGGRDSISAGGGDDGVAARDGMRDRSLSCGAGNDRLGRDRNDPRPASCERKLRPRI